MDAALSLMNTRLARIVGEPANVGYGGPVRRGGGFRPSPPPSRSLATRAASFLRLYAFELHFGLAASRIIPNRMRGVLWRLGKVKLGPLPTLRYGTVIQRGTLEIGERFVCGWGCLIDATGRITIGDRVHLGPLSVVLSNDHQVQPSVIRRDPTDNIPRHTRIGDGCWIGATSVILPGVVIGEGCVIAAGSTVTRDCEPNGLYAGSPAKRIKDLPALPGAPIDA